MRRVKTERRGKKEKVGTCLCNILAMCTRLALPAADLHHFSVPSSVAGCVFFTSRCVFSVRLH
jgi:hypothetical protein